MKEMKRWIITFCVTMLLLLGCSQSSTAGMLDFMKESWRVKTPYTTIDKVIYVSAVAAHVADAYSTIEGMKYGAREVDPIGVFFMGEYPDDWQIVAYKAGGIALMTLGANNTKGLIRKVFLIANTVIIGRVTISNFDVLKEMKQR